jgi:NADH-quinone oxidoreductase subunit A
VSGPAYLGAYAVVLAVLVTGVGFVAVAMGANRLLRPAVPTPQKLVGYECGVDPVGEGWAQTHIRYYVFAYLYVVFAIDAVYLFPWATVLDAPGFGVTTLVEMAVFLAVVALGIVYVVRRRVVGWT